MNFHDRMARLEARMDKLDGREAEEWAAEEWAALVEYLDTGITEGVYAQKMAEGPLKFYCLGENKDVVKMAGMFGEMVAKQVFSRYRAEKRARGES